MVENKALASKSNCENTLPQNSNIICFLFQPLGNPPEPWFTFSTPCYPPVFNNQPLSFFSSRHVHSSQMPMEGPQSTNPFVLQVFQLLTFTAPATLACLVFGIFSLLVTNVSKRVTLTDSRAGPWCWELPSLKCFSSPVRACRELFKARALILLLVFSNLWITEVVEPTYCI